MGVTQLGVRSSLSICMCIPAAALAAVLVAGAAHVGSACSPGLYSWGATIFVSSAGSEAVLRAREDR